MVRVYNFKRLRPWPALAAADQKLLEHVYERTKTQNEPIERSMLRFECGSTDDDLRRLQELQLLEVSDRGFSPTVLALLYISEARDELERLDELVRLAHERYHPKKLTVVANEVGSPWTPWIRQLAAGLHVQSNTDGDLVLTDWNFDHATFEDAFLYRYSGQLRNKSMVLQEAGISELSPLPFDFRLTRLHVRNFRALREIDLPLGPLAVLVGPNGAGKSTLLDVLSFVRTATQESLHQAAEQEGGIDFLGTRGSQGAIRIVLTFTMDHGHGPIEGRYLLAFDRLGEEPIVENEVLWVGDEKLFDKRRGQTVFRDASGVEQELFTAASDLGLSLLAKRDDQPIAKGLQRALGQMVLIDRDPLILSDDAVSYFGRGGFGQKTRQSAALMPLLSGIATDPDLLATLATIVGELIPTVRGIKAHVITGEEPILEVTMAGVEGPLRVDELSSGTRQILLFAALYVAPTPYQVIMAEEPDAGLHPARQAALVDLLHSLAELSTVIATTHSPTFVSRLSPDREVWALVPTEKGPRVESLSDVIGKEPWLRNFGEHGEAFARRGGD